MINEPTLTNNQIDRLGERLKSGAASEVDLRLLDRYRRSFAEAYETVIDTMQGQLRLQPTGRPAKSTSSIVEKLHRESIRLTQMQDIAGCRVIVADVTAQDAVVHQITDVFQAAANVMDRRKHPSYGYRAVHVVLKCHGRLVEVQVRSAIQHGWAELSEKLSDIFDPALKYGGGNDVLRTYLMDSSGMVAEIETAEMQLTASPKLKPQDIAELQKIMASNKSTLAKSFDDLIERLKKAKS